MARPVNMPELCRMLGCKAWHVQYAIEQDVVTPEKVGGIRLFTGEDILTLRAWFARERKQGRTPKEMPGV